MKATVRLMCPPAPSENEFDTPALNVFMPWYFDLIGLAKYWFCINPPTDSLFASILCWHSNNIFFHITLQSHYSAVIISNFVHSPKTSIPTTFQFSLGISSWHHLSQKENRYHQLDIFLFSKLPIIFLLSLSIVTLSLFAPSPIFSGTLHNQVSFSLCNSF